MFSFLLKQVETDESAPKPQKEEINNEVEVQINLNRLKQIIKKFADEGERVNSHGTNKIHDLKNVLLVFKNIINSIFFLELPQLSPERFEKDDDSNGHIDFIASTSVIRLCIVM